MLTNPAVLIITRQTVACTVVGMALTPPDPQLSDGVVVLRPMDERDLAAIERSARDAEIQRWFGPSRGRPAEEVLAGKRGAWADGTTASFAICDVPSPQACLGQVFIEPDDEGRGLVGYWLLSEGRGCGRATRAVRLISRWALTELGLVRAHLWVEPENTASGAVAERAGFQREGVLRSYVLRRDGRRADAVFYSLLASDLRPMESQPELAQADLEALVALHTERIAELVPEGRTSVSGSTLLSVYGGHDVDLVVLVPSVEQAANRLRGSYPPLYEEEWRDDWAAFGLEGPPQVDIVLTKPGTKGDAHHRRAWELILANPQLRAEYERLKAAGMDSPRKADFFNGVVAMLPPQD